ncbi:MAG TPA: hypothetical protein VGR56_04120 [Nitrososphaerales archaeon]|nr:hypothetical protein [Nitrososphaerales archaeon]
MKPSAGALEAPGRELRRLRDPRLAAAIIGLAQLFAYIGFIDSNLIFPSVLSTEISLAVFAASGVLLLTLRFSTAPFGAYKMDWKYLVGSGELEVSYVNPRGKKRTGLIVKKVEPRPNTPLYKVAGQSLEGVTGTSASIVIDFKNLDTISLNLGFATVAEMNSIYEKFVGKV